VLALGLAAGCGSSAARTPPAANGASPAGTTTAAASPSPEPPRDITLTFAGDVHFMDRTARLLDNPQTAFGPVAEVFKNSDVAMVNLETAITGRGAPEPKQYHFRSPPAGLDAVKAAGVKLVTIANNHSLDYGQLGLADTVAALKAAGLPYVGAGTTAAEAWQPWITDVRGTKIAYIGISQIWELATTWVARDNRPGVAIASDVDRSVNAVKAAKKQADLVVVYMHWGHEGDQCPTGEQKTFAAKLAAAGTDLIVGTHAHLLQGDGWLGQTYVAYGFGNFVWWLNDAFSNDTGVLRVTVRDKKVVKGELVPAFISRQTGQPIPQTGADADRITKKYAQLRPCTGLATQPS